VEGLLRNGAQAYAFTYFGVILAVALLEMARPRRVPGEVLRLRWFGNFSLTIIGAVLVRVLFPVAGVGWAVFCEERGLGLLLYAPWPWWLELTIAVVFLDGIAYVQHVLLHRIPLLWRLHRTHHSDHEYDFTTGVRFHPFETVYSTAFLMAAVALIGASPAAVLVAQVLSVALAFIEHGNVQIPAAADRVLRLVFVTPDMHRIHHSQDLREGESNFSNVFSLWDRLFGTYVDQPAAGHDGIVFGVTELSERKHLTLPWMLAQPFLRLETPGRRGDAAELAHPSDIQPGSIPPGSLRT
jgi:sterol desaturase/sphingolipid hydroxylase (fatty acid hydroxylase superfamily)